MESGDRVSWLRVTLWKGSHGELKKEVGVVRVGTKSTKIPQTNGETWAEQTDEAEPKTRGAALIMITIITQGRGRTTVSSPASATPWLRHLGQMTY